MHLIVGTGLAAVRAVESLRESGSSAPIVMIGAERALPYERPPLSKELLRGETTLDRPRDLPAARKLVAQRARVDERRITDEAKPLLEAASVAAPQV